MLHLYRLPPGLDMLKNLRNTALGFYITALKSGGPQDIEMVFGKLPHVTTCYWQYLENPTLAKILIFFGNIPKRLLK